VLQQQLPASFRQKSHCRYSRCSQRLGFYTVSSQWPIYIIYKWMETSCRRAAATGCPAPLLPGGRRSAFRRRADSNVAAVSHGQHVLTPTAAAAWRANTSVSKVTLTFDLLTLKVVSESRVTWATSVPILAFLGLSVLDLGLMYATYRQTDVRQQHRLMPPTISGRGIIKFTHTI